jgi:sarcosine oxidase
MKSFSNAYDVIIAGLGTVGSATAMELARRGHSVIGLDVFRPPHNRGSHHGQSRSIRRAYLEGTGYVPMALRAWELWRRLERDTGTSLLVSTGNLTIGLPDGPALKGFLGSARTGNIPHHALTAAEVRKRWPQLAPSDALAAGLEVEAGLLFPELSITTLLNESERAGAVLRFDERVEHWSKHGDRIRVHTTRETLEGGSLLLAAGARNKSLLGILGDRLSPKRVPVHWVAPPSEKAFELGNFPVNFWQLPAFEIESNTQYAELYSLPVIGSGGCVKVAAHNNLSDCDPEAPVRFVTPEEVADIRSFLGNFIPTLANCTIDSDVCLYTQTPDGEFLLGALPGYDNVFTAALAGHGFKFAPVLGEVLADLIAGTEPAFDVSRFSPARTV